MSRRRPALALAAAALLAPALVAPATGTTAGGGGPLAAGVAVDWQRTAARTIYTERGTPPPLGTVYLAFTSLAVHDAAGRAARHGTHAAAAAVAVAAHDVLLEYFSDSAPGLDADLATSLAMVPDGRSEDVGSGIGAAAAARMIASRVGDGRGDTSIVYSKPEALGVWQPPEGGAMVLPWLGFVDPVVDVDPISVDGPDHHLSEAYAADYEEVRLVGNVGSATRSEHQTAVATFFANNPVFMYRNALAQYLDDHPMGLLPTTRLFARIDAAVATTAIETSRLKYTLGFWRPFQAIAAGAVDGNPGTHPHPTPWVPLVPNPAYSDYTSGHASATAPFAEVLRRSLGDDTPLLLKAGALQRPYASLSALEHDALHARIWGGLHFRDAMDDGYVLGHATAASVMSVVR